MDPTRQSRILGADGRPYQRAAAPAPSGRAGRPTDDALPHVLTFSALLNPHNRVYYSGRWDQAMAHSRQDAVVMENDCFLMGLMQERTRAVTSLPWHLETDDEDDPVQALVRDHLTNAIKKTPRFRYMLKWLYKDGTWKGRTAAQLSKYRWVMMPDPNGMPVRTLTVARWLPVNGDKINHTWDHVPTVQVSAAQDDLPDAEYVWDNQTKAIVLKGTWRDHFQFYYNDPEDTDYFDGVFAAEAVHGRGVRSVVFWWNWIRLERLSQVGDYFDRVGQGVTLWYYELGNAASEAAVTKAAAEQSDKVNIVLPRSPNAAKGQGMERVETPVSGADAVSRIAVAIEDHIERYIVGQSMSSGKDSTGSLGGTGRAEFAADTKGDITEEGASNLGECLTGSDVEFGLVRHLHKHTFPQYAPGQPKGFEVRFKLGVKDPKAKERLEAIKTVVSLGVDVAADDAREAAGLKKPKEGDELCSGGMQDMGMGPDGPGGPPQPGGPKGKGGKGDWSPQHGPRGGKWEVNRKSGTKRHQKPQGAGPQRFRMGLDGRPEWTRPWRFHGGFPGHYDPNEPRVPAGSPEGGEWTAMGAGELQEHHASNLAGLSAALQAPRYGEQHAAAVRTHGRAVMDIQAEMQRRNLPDAPAPAPEAAAGRLWNQLGLGQHVRPRFDEAFGTEEQQKRHAANDKARGTRGENARMQAEWHSRAAAAGFGPADLRGVVEDMRTQDRERVREHNTALGRARKLLQHYGVDPHRMVQGARREGGDAASVKAMDVVARSVAKEHPELFPGLIGSLDDNNDTTDVAGPLLDLLTEGNLRPMAEEDLHEDALSYLEEMAAHMRPDGGADADTDLEDELRGTPAAEPDTETEEPADGDASFNPGDFDAPQEPRDWRKEPKADLGDEEIKRLAGADAPKPPGGLENDPDYVKHVKPAWDVVSRLWPEMAAKVKKIGLMDTKGGLGAAGANASMNPFNGELAVKPGAALSPESLWHELVHLDQAGQGRLKPRMEMDPDDFNEREIEAIHRARSAAALFPRLQQHLAPAAATPAPQKPARPGVQGQVGQTVPLLPATQAGPTPSPKRPGVQGHANDILLTSAQAGRTPGADLDARSGAARRDAGIAGVGAFPRRHGMREAVGQVFRWLMGGPDRFAKAPPAKGQRGLWDEAEHPRAPAGSPEGGEWTDEKLGAHGDAMVAHGKAGEHQKALGLFREPPLEHARRLVPELPEETVAGMAGAVEAPAAAPQPEQPKPASVEDLAAQPMSKMKPEWFHGASPPAIPDQTFHVEKAPDGTYKVWKQWKNNPHLKTPVSEGKDAELTMNNIWRAGGAWNRDSEEYRAILAKGAAAPSAPPTSPKNLLGESAAPPKQAPEHAEGGGKAAAPQAAEAGPTPAAAAPPQPAAPRLEPGSREHWLESGRPGEDYGLAAKLPEFAAWQERARHHHGLTGITAKLKHRPQLEAAHKAMTAALAKARQPARKFRMRGRPDRHAAPPVVVQTPAAPPGVLEYVRDDAGLVVGTRQVIEREVVRDPETRRITGTQPRQPKGTP